MLNKGVRSAIFLSEVLWKTRIKSTKLKMLKYVSKMYFLSPESGPSEQSSTLLGYYCLYFMWRQNFTAQDAIIKTVLWSLGNAGTKNVIFYHVFGM